MLCRVCLTVSKHQCLIPVPVLSNCCRLLLTGIQFRLPTSCSVDRAHPPPGTSLSPFFLLFPLLALISANGISAAVTHRWLYQRGTGNYEPKKRGTAVENLNLNINIETISFQNNAL